MANDIADIGINVDTSSVVKATTDLKELARQSLEVYKANKEVASGADRLNTYFNSIDAQLTKVNGNMRRTTALFQQSGKGLRNFEVQVQQAGYQVGDFAVQVMSGTNPLVAFGQQASQLAGFFGGPWGAAIGAGIAIISALGGAFWRASEDSKASLENFKETISSLQSEIDSLHLDNIKIGFSVDSNALAKAKEELLLIQKSILDEQIRMQEQYKSNISGFALSSGAQAVQGGKSQALIDLENQRKEIQNKLNLLDAEKEAQRMLNGGLSVASGLQKAAIRDKQAALQATKDQALAEQAAADKANYLKSVFHALAGEAGAVSVNVGQWAGHIDAAISALGRYNAQATLNAKMVGRGLPAGFGQGIVGGISTSPIPQGRPIDLAENAAEAAANAAKKTGGGGGGNARLETLLASLGTEKEQLDAWYQQSQDDLQAASDKELEIVGGREEAKHRLIMEYQQKQYDAQQAQTQLLFQSQSGMYSALGDLLGQFAGKSKGAAVAALAIQKGLAIAQIVTSTAAAQMRAYAEMGPIAGAAMAAKIGLLGKLQMGLVAATGLAQAGSIMSGGSSSSGRGSVGTSSVSSSASASPTTVMIQGMKPTDIFTGEQLSTLFDSLYKENNNRGMVFMVQR